MLTLYLCFSFLPGQTLFTLHLVGRYYWQFNSDDPGKMVFFSPEPFRVLLSDVTFLSVFTSHGVSDSQVSEVSEIVVMFFMMSEAQ